ncbi:hypothetical protein HMPREF9946_03996 [Acetobacteraceae bacterium AT-5844]|nr:hypothetical protein HMPREF9946_03996 [Acetobacteraceae bacterium AT-5844]
MRRNSTRALQLAHLVGPAIRASEDDEQDDKARRAEDDENDRDDKPGSGRARRADDDKDKDEEKPQGRSKSRRAKSRASEDEDEQEDKPSGRRARRAEDEEDDEADPKGRRTAAEEEEDDERGEEEERKDDEDDADPKTRAARRRERERCQAIIGSKHAKGRAAAAAHLAFGTGMSARAAIGLLKTLPGGESAEGSDLGARMQSYGGHRPAASAPPAPSGRQAVSNSWDAAAARAGIRKS